MNNVTIIGNLCRDPELRQGANGVTFASTTIASKRDRKDADGTYKSDFFDLLIWGNQAEYTSKYIRKGDKAVVTGTIQIRDYVTKTGVKGKAVEVFVQSVSSLEKKAESPDVVDPKELQPEAQVDDEDLPF